MRNPPGGGKNAVLDAGGEPSDGSCNTPSASHTDRNGVLSGDVRQLVVVRDERRPVRPRPGDDPPHLPKLGQRL